MSNLIELFLNYRNIPAGFMQWFEYVLNNFLSNTSVTITSALFCVTAFVYDKLIKNKKVDSVVNTISKEVEITNDYHSPTLCISIITHNRMLSALEYAAKNCNNTQYTLVCIDIIKCCPQLMNVKCKFDGLTPFHHVCRQGRSCLITYMLGRGADPTLKTKDGQDALCLAVCHVLANPAKTDLTCLDILVKAGCNLLSTNWYDRFIEAAVMVNHTKLIGWLFEHLNTNRKLHRTLSVPLKF